MQLKRSFTATAGRLEPESSTFGDHEVLAVMPFSASMNQFGCDFPNSQCTVRLDKSHLGKQLKKLCDRNRTSCAEEVIMAVKKHLLANGLWPEKAKKKADS